MIFTGSGIAQESISQGLKPGSLSVQHAKAEALAYPEATTQR
jgi:hypothetical protein